MSLPDTAEISIIIVSYNSAAVLADCLLSLLQQKTHLQYEIIVVDNASEDKSCQIVEEICPAARQCRLSNNLGYGAGCNAGAAIAQGRYLVFLNPRDSNGILLRFIFKNSKNLKLVFISPNSKKVAATV